jgi:para-aminobenzoate synthetase component 1
MKDQVHIRVRPVLLPHGPRDVMSRLRADGRYALLESAMAMPQAQWSFIAGPGLATLSTDETVTRLVCDGKVCAAWTDPLAALAAVGDRDPHGICFDGERPAGMSFCGGWIGVVGYDLVRAIERLPQLARHDPPLPRQWWMAVDQVLAFHHGSGQWWHATARVPARRWPWMRGEREGRWRRTLEVAAGPARAKGTWQTGERVLRSGREQFEDGVRSIRRAIEAGDLLQVNLTRREDAAFTGDPWALYEDLVQAHPAPFAAFLEGPGFAIASCSPERFLHRRGADIEARPIKGTIGRGGSEAEDEALRSKLAASIKDRAENLMIVDLMRNDLGRIARIGSVRVPELFALEPYASVWQMVSTITARLRADVDLAVMLRACWPPGSMSGAPKVKAMEVIEAMEPFRRGWYSGSIGYLDFGGDFDLSVVIRMAIVAGDRVMLQLGGGIVADSDPACEWEETVAKGACLTALLDRSRADCEQKEETACRPI